MHAETVLGLAYGAFLALTAAGFDALARRRLGRHGAGGEPPWPQVAAARLERSVGSLLLVLAAVLIGAVAVRHPQGHDLAAAAAGFAVLAAGVAWRHRRCTPPDVTQDADVPHARA